MAILLEFGTKDIAGRDWSGQAVVSGAKIVHSEGYRFRPDDKVEAKGEAISWQAKTRPPLRAPKGQPAITKLEPVATVGVVLHLEDVDDKTTLSVQHGDGKEAVTVEGVRAGKAQSLFKRRRGRAAHHHGHAGGRHQAGGGHAGRLSWP